MDGNTLISSLRPVEVRGFQLSFTVAGKRGDIRIKKEGRRCTHFYISRTPFTSEESYTAIMEEALSDFIETARVGGWSKKAYVEMYGWGEEKEEIDSAWRVYKSTRKKLEKLLGCDPTSFIEHFFSDKEK